MHTGPPIPRPHAPRLRAGFSLFELVAVIGVLGVIGASALPATSKLRTFHVEAARTEVRTYLGFARDAAAATGFPTGVSFNTTSHLMNLSRIGQPGRPPTILADHSGVPREPVRIDRHAGLEIVGVAGTGVVGPTRIVWFGHAGIPEQRDSSGAYLGDAPADIVVSFTSGDPITVSAHTGLIQ